jgi:hypothetical protein
MDPLPFDGLDRKDYKDLEPLDFKAAERYDFGMLKYDGIWCRLVFFGEYAYYFSRTNQLKQKRRKTDWENSNYPGTCVFLGEFMYGQQWAIRQGLEGMIFLWDCIMFNGIDITNWVFTSRRMHLTSFKYAKSSESTVRRCALFTKDQYKVVWEDFVTKLGWEGMVFLNSKGDYETDQLARMKGVYTDDVYIVNCLEGDRKNTGKLGAIEVSAKRGGPVICKVGGGFTDNERESIWFDRAHLKGKCITVSSNKRFASGALRSPQFICFHSEK